ncbi:MAG: acetylglutamate kinase [Planctomycetia bacterium]|nr:acetylglutamate kinase [Planctomycetia bacterium]
MLNAIEKADVLLEALHWIRKFREKIIVVKLGGSLMKDPQALSHLLEDLVFMETVGLKPVLVHGGGPAINRAMIEAGIESHFVMGRRYTCQKTLEIVEKVLATELNEQLVEQIIILGGQARSLNFRTKNVVYGEKLELQDENGQNVDFGYVGNATRIDMAPVLDLLQQRIIPVIPSMCVTQTGQKLNVNADTVATVVAQAFQAEKLIFLSDVNGVRRDKDDPESLVPTLTAKMARQMFADGTIVAGMIPKVQACLETIAHGVHKVHIVDGTIRHALLLEIFTTQGVGTEIIAGRE